MAQEHKGLILGILAMSQLMIVLDASIVNIALRYIQEGLGFPAVDLQWVVTSYTLMFGGFLLLGGRFADRLGRKRMFMTGLVIFTVASALGGGAWNEASLIVARGLQGFGAALMAPAALSMIAVIFAEGPERNKAFGIWGGVSASGAAIGLLLGAVLVEFLNWRWVLLVNIPFGIVALALTAKFVPESRSEHRTVFDVFGAVTVTAGLIALVYTLVRGNEVGWQSAQTLVTAGLSTVLLAAFVVIEKRHGAPLLPMRIFENRNLAGADIAGLLVAGGMFSMFFFMSLYVQIVLDYSPIEQGFAFLVTPLAIGSAAAFASKNLHRYGPRKLATIGFLIGAFGLALMTRVEPGGDYVSHVAIPLIVVGLGMGLGFVSITTAALSGVRAQDTGLASALLNTAQQIGGSLGLAVLTAVTAARLDAVSTDPTRPLLSEITSSYAWGFGTGSVLLLLGAIVINTMVRTKASEVPAASSAAAVHS